MSKKLLLKIVPPNKSAYSVECDSIKLNISENSKGKSAGSYGIRQGHAKALIAIDEGTISAYENQNCVFSVKTSVGFATIDSDIVTVLAEEI